MANNDGQIVLGLDIVKTISQINEDIKKLQDKLSQVQISGSLDTNSTIKELNSQISLLQGQIKNIELKTSIDISKAKQTGQQMGKLISDSAEKAINSVGSSSIGKYFKIDSSTSNEFKREIEKLVNDWTDAKGQLTDIKIDTRTSFDKDVGENITRLHQATITYSNELDEVIKKTIAWRQIGTNTNINGEVEVLRGFVEVASQYSKSLDTVSVKTDSFIDKQKKVIGQLQNTLSSIQSGYQDKNSSKPIKNQINIDALDNQYRLVEQSITNLENANSSAFTDMELKTRKQISALQSMIKEYRNAENVSTKMKGTDFASGLAIAQNDLDKFRSDAKDFPQITKTINDLDGAISKVGDAASLNSFNDQLRVARSELAKVKSEVSSINRNEKVGINVSGLESKIAEIQKVSPKINEFRAQINDAEVSVESLLFDLSQVDTQGDFSVINSKFKAFVDSAKVAGFAVTEVVDNSKKLENIQLSIENGTYSTQIEKLKAQFQQYGLSVDQAEEKVKELRSTLTTMEHSSSDELASNFSNWEKQIKSVKVQIDQAKLSFDKFAQPVSDEKLTSLLTKIQNFLEKNTAISKLAKTQLGLYVNELNGGNISLGRWNAINSELTKTETEMRSIGKLGKSFSDQMNQAAASFTQWLSVSSVIMLFISKTKNAVTELKEIDTILTEISKTSELTKNQLIELGNTSFDTASIYGKKASDYLYGVQEMYRAGYKNGEALAELSVLTQSAGDLTKDLANDYLIASDAAYGYQGNVEKLTALLDGQNQVTNRNAVSMKELASATKVAGSTLANVGSLPENELTALLGTGIATSRESGETVARAIKSIMMNLQGVAGEGGFDGEIIDEESLKKVEKRCHSLGVELEYMQNGMTKLRKSTDVLRDLANVYNSLPKDSTERAGLIADIGGKYRANVLSNILSNWNKYEKMLSDYENSAGSAMKEAMKSANNWEGSLNRLSNTLSDTVGNIVESDIIIGGLNGFNGLLQLINELTGSLNSFSSIGGLTGLVMALKGVGKPTFQW